MPHSPDTPPLLQVQDLRVAYGKAEALHGISLQVQAGEIVALLGANGAGKTTTLRTLSGLLKARTGTIVYDGQPIHHLPAERIVRLGIAQSPEERHIWAAMTVHENLMMGAYIRKSHDAIEQGIGMVYHRFPRLKERHRQLAGTLSGGEQQMLAIGRALMSEPKLLLLDEPSLGLSPRMADEVFDVVRQINAHGVTVVVVEQNVHNALSIASRAYVFETGEIVAEKASEQLLSDPQLLRSYLGG